MSVKKINEVKKEKVSAGVKTYKQVLVSADEAPNFAMRKFIIEPGGSMPMHKNTVEHEQYVLKGKAEVSIGGKTFIVNKDDIVFIPSGVEHNYKTIGDENFEFLCIVPNKEDKITVTK
jgi:quercetin dioxygenase-like cupin family protein